MKTAVAGLFANWLGVFSSSFLFITKYAFIAIILIYFLEFLPGVYPILFIGTTAIALIYFFYWISYALDILILTWHYWIEEERDCLPDRKNVRLVESSLCKDYIIFCFVIGIYSVYYTRSCCEVFVCDGAIYSWRTEGLFNKRSISASQTRSWRSINGSFLFAIKFYWMGYSWYFNIRNRFYFY